MKLISLKEAKALGLKRYCTGKACLKGHVEERNVASRACMECARLKVIGKDKVLEEQVNGVRISRKQAKRDGLKFYFTCHPCKSGHLAKRYVRNGECFQCAEVTWKNRDKVKSAAQVMKYYYKNREKVIEKTVERHRLIGYNAQRRAAKLKATPLWVDIDAIRKIYSSCPKGYHVDHIIPLQGKNVCGLHIAENLQILSAKENITKGNKF